MRTSLRFSARHLFIGTTVVAVAITLLLNWEIIARRAEKQAHAEAVRKERERRSALLVALESGDADTVAKLLRAGASPNCDWPSGMAIEIAIRHGHVKCLEYLLAAGARSSGPALLSSGDASPLAQVYRSPESSVQQKLEMVQLLVSAGAAINADVIDAVAENADPVFRSDLEKRGARFGLRELVIANSADEVCDLLTRNRELINKPVSWYLGTRSLLGIALCRGNCRLAHWLLDHQASLEMHEVHQCNAVHQAAIGNCDSIIPRLIQLGSSVDVGDVTGDTPIDYCIVTASPATIRALLDGGANARSARRPILAALLDRIKKAMERESRNEGDGTQSNLEDCYQIAEMLVDAGADPNAEYRNGQSIIEHVRQQRLDRLINILVR